MPRLKVLSGKDLISIFAEFGFSVASQKGSHVKLRKEQTSGRQTLTIPLHNPLDKGTLRAIYTQAQKYISAEDLQPHFYTP